MKRLFAILTSLSIIALLGSACMPLPSLTIQWGTEGTKVAQASTAAADARLVVRSTPAGAQVRLDGQARGATPLKLAITAGPHTISLSLPGCALLEDTFTARPGEEKVISRDLEDIAPPVIDLSVEPASAGWNERVHLVARATDNVGLSELQLLLDEQVLLSSRDGLIDLALLPADIPGLSGGEYTITARAADVSGNRYAETTTLMVVAPEGMEAGEGSVETQTPRIEAQPTATSISESSQPPIQAEGTPSQVLPLPPSAATPPAVVAQASGTSSGEQAASLSSLAFNSSAGGAATLRHEQITIPTYPYASFLSSAVDTGVGNYPLLTLDRAAYLASAPQPEPVTYELLVLENAYLRVSLLPALGGRVYECTFKPTGHNEFYRNPVIKPTQWGPPNSSHPEGANWWLAAGGLEWGFPVEEHGYEWGAEWSYQTLENSDGSVSVDLHSGEDIALHAGVRVTLPANSAAFTVQPVIYNGTGSTQRFKWWTNAMLAPGAANSPSADLRFILPTSEVTVHSSGDPSLPGAGQPMSWPLANGRDLSRLGNWNEWLGAFARPAALAGYAGVYDTAANEGMLRIFPADIARGVKIFAMGGSHPIDWSEWTDEASGYVELHGGLAPTFDDWSELKAGEHITWKETWFPAVGIGQVTFATENGAVNLSPAGDTLDCGIFPVKTLSGQLDIRAGSQSVLSRSVQISPEHPFAERVSLPAGANDLSLTLTDARGAILLAYPASTP